MNKFSSSPKMRTRFGTFVNPAASASMLSVTKNK